MTLDAELHKLAGTLDFEFDKKAVGSDGSIIIEGIAATLVPDREGDVIERGAMERAVAGYMRNPILLWYHRFEDVLGQVEKAEVTSQGLLVRARVEKPAETSPLFDVYEKIRRGVIRAFSIGARFKKKLGTGGVTVITDMDWAETSIAPIGIQPTATFTVTSSKALGLDEELSRLTALTSSSLDDALDTLRAL
jgi:HK97 family phage prohead protease